MQRDKSKSTNDTYRFMSNKGISPYTNHMSRDKLTVNLFSSKTSTIKQTMQCGQCSTEEARMKCLECVEYYCADCFNNFHLRGALQRHHRIFLTENQLLISPKKNRSFNSDLNLRDLSNRQSNDDLNRKSMMTLNIRESEDLRNTKTNYASFQKPFSSWRTNNNVNKSKMIREKDGFITPINEIQSDRSEQFHRLPNIDSNSSRISSNEKILSNRDRYVDKTNKKKSLQQSKKTKTAKKDEPKIGVMINIYYALTENAELNDPGTDIETVAENISDIPTERSVQDITTEEVPNTETQIEYVEEAPPQNETHAEEPERPVTRISSKSYSGVASPSVKKNSLTIVEESLRSELAIKSNEELEEIVNSELILSHSLLSSIDTYEGPLTPLVPKQPHEDSKSTPSTIIVHYPVAHFDSSLNDLSYESKIVSNNHFNETSESSSSIESEQPELIDSQVPENSPIITQRRPSPFSFTYGSNELHRVNSSSSIDTNDDCFFTDVSPQKTSITPRSVTKSNLNANDYRLESQRDKQNQIRKNSISKVQPTVKSIQRRNSKQFPKRNKSIDQSKNETNRSESSSTSVSLPVSIEISSKSEFNHRTSQCSTTTSSSSRKSSSSSISTSSSESIQTTTTSNSSSAKRKTSSSSRPQSTTSTATINSSSTATPTSNRLSSSTSTPSNAASSTKTNSSPIPESTPSITRENSTPKSPIINHEFIQESTKSLNDKSLSKLDTINNENYSMVKEKIRHRRVSTNEDISKFRKLEFSMEDGLKWQAASAESLSSTKTLSSIQSLSNSNFRPLTPKQINSTRRSTLMYEKFDHNEKSLNYIHQEPNSIC